MNFRPDFNLIRTMADEIRDALGDEFDAVAFLDTLDGETDAGTLADWLMAQLAEAEAMGDAVQAQEADLRARRQRYEARGVAFRRQLLNLLDAIGEKKIERPRATASRRSGLPSVQITDETAVPTQLCKTVTSPDKAAIKAQLLAGETVPGAQIVMGDDAVAVRFK